MEEQKRRYHRLILIIGLILTFIISYFYSTLYKQSQKKEAQHTVELYSTRIESLLTSLFHKTDILESIIITSKGEVPEATFNDLAKSMTNRGVRAIQYLPDGIVKYCYPIEGNEKAIGENIFSKPLRKDDANLAKETKEIALSGPYVLTQGGFGLVARNPIFLTQSDGSEKFWGFSVVVLDLPEALEPLMFEELQRNNYEYNLYTTIDNKKVDIIKSQEFVSDNSIKGTIKVPNHTWELALSRKMDRQYYINLILILVFGFGISALCALIFKMMEERNGQLKKYAEVDSLTGLVNRRKFINYMELRFRNTKAPLGLLYIDINNFKDINDTYGHMQGDVLLKEAGHRLKQHIASEDVVARMGGDEFIIALEHENEEETCKEKMIELAKILHEPIQLDKTEIQITVSIGYALFPSQANTLKGVIEIADQRMYEMKNKQKR